MARKVIASVYVTLDGVLEDSGGALALIPFVLGLLAAFVAYGRWRLRPLGR